MLRKHTKHLSTSDFFEMGSFLRSQMMHTYLGYKAPVSTRKLAESSTIPVRASLSEQAWQRAVDNRNKHQESLASLLAAVNPAVFTRPNARVWGAICFLLLTQGLTINVSRRSLAKLARGVVVDGKVCRAGAYPREIAAVLWMLHDLGVGTYFPGNDLWWGQGGTFVIEKAELVLLLNDLPEQRLGASSIEWGPTPQAQNPVTSRFSTIDTTLANVYKGREDEGSRELLGEDEGGVARAEIEEMRARETRANQRVVTLSDLLAEHCLYWNNQGTDKARLTRFAHRTASEMGLRWREGWADWEQVIPRKAYFLTGTKLQLAELAHRLKSKFPPPAPRPCRGMDYVHVLLGQV
jgi:hypothetical protein